ncbi:hypothetical protein, partial [Rubrivirga sp.]|uniref:hypothetical protein n=1 Tax=Rubrivirga sp. TaxID=1885344 RepID=UPI003C7753AA
MNYTFLWMAIAAALIQTQGVHTTDPQTEDVCERERKEFYALSLPIRQEGSTARRRLLLELEEILERHERTAPECAGRLVENKAYLLIIEGELGEASEVIGDYLDAREGGDATAQGTAESYVRLLIQRGYVLAELGRTVEGARSYYKAASMSYTVEA